MDEQLIQELRYCTWYCVLLAKHRLGQLFDIVSAEFPTGKQTAEFFYVQ